MATKPGERRLQILQTLAEMLETPKGRKSPPLRWRPNWNAPKRRSTATSQQGPDVRRPDRIHRTKPVQCDQPDHFRGNRRFQANRTDHRPVATLRPEESRA